MVSLAPAREEPMKTVSRISAGERIPIWRIAVSMSRIATDFPESDGTLEWDSTTIVLVEATAGNQTGIGYTYADDATAQLIRGLLAKEVEGRDALSIPECWQAMTRRIRNLGRPGIASMAISAVDIALWDLKARLLNLPLAKLLGTAQESVAIYASGVFTPKEVELLSIALDASYRTCMRRVPAVT